MTTENTMTSGRAAYEAWLAAEAARLGSLTGSRCPWESMPDAVRADWDAAALAAIQAVLAEFMPADRLRSERDEARAVVAEMCAWRERAGTAREEDEMIPQWRERAGLGEQQ